MNVGQDQQGGGSTESGGAEAGGAEAGARGRRSGSEPGASEGGVTVGLRASATVEVTDGDTAAALGSGDVPVLGTPRLLALAEAASVAAVAPQLGAGETTVGIEVSLEHSRPSPVGSTVEVSAELTEIHRRRLVFRFIAYGRVDDEKAVIGAGTVHRMVVDRDRFLASAQVPHTPVVDRG